MDEPDNQKKQAKTSLVHFWAIMALGTLLYSYTLSVSGETKICGNEVQVVLVSILSSLELFVGQTHLYDGIISAAVFDKPVPILMYSRRWLSENTSDGWRHTK